MELLKDIHRLALPIPVVGHHLVFLTALLTVWSLVLAVRATVPVGFVYLLRLSWVAFGINTLTGLILGVAGQRVPSAVPATPGGRLTTLNLPVDSSRHWEHLMYAAFALLTLYAIEVLIAGRVVPRQVGLRFLPVATLFLIGVAYMAVRVAYLPGSTPDA